MPCMIQLTRGKVLRLPQRAGAIVTVSAGTLWLTEEGGRDDVMLRPGQSFRLLKDGVALVEAFSDAALWVER